MPRGTLPKAIARSTRCRAARLRDLHGDLTHTTDDPAERRKRMTEFKDIVASSR
jgi:hypothetical protein